METTSSLKDDGESGSSPSSGYWSTNDDDLSNDVISASLGFDPSVGYGGCWLPSPNRDLETELDDGDVVGLSLRAAHTSKPDDGFEQEVRFRPEAELDFRSEMDLEAEVVLDREASAAADFKLDHLTTLTDVGSGPEPEMSLATGSSLLADFLFCDWLQGSRSTNRIFDDFISGDVFPDDVFGEQELALVDTGARWKDTSAASPRECVRGSHADDEEEERTVLDEHRILSTDLLTFDLDPGHEFEEPYTPVSRPISPFDCYPMPEPDLASSSGCGSPLDVTSRTATPATSDFRSSCLDSAELFDVLLCEVVRQAPEANARPDVTKPELVLVATPSASKRKASEDAESQPLRKTPRLGEFRAGKRRPEETGIREGSRSIELPVTLVAASSNMLQVTSACDRLPSDGSRSISDPHVTGKTQRGRDSRTWGEFPCAEMPQMRSEPPKTDNENSLTKSDNIACAPEATPGGDACAFRRAEVLAAMLQAEAVLREPNRGSDVIFAELRRRASSVADPRSPSSVVPSSPPGPSQPRGASSLRSFLIRKQRDSAAATGQNLLHRLLKGETSEADVRREQAASRQATGGDGAAPGRS